MVLSLRVGLHMGLPLGLSVSLGLRYRLLWFWVFGCAIPRVLPMGLGSG